MHGVVMTQSKRKGKRSSPGLIDWLKRNNIEPTMDSKIDLERAKKLKFNGNGAKFEYVGDK